ncbi:WxL domain-containing protein [Enterococcus sp. AZ072]|uniref:WxL domain-containing protein n=1 Tax=unclassified Enterococcus TaxID=2608891 RepID=UPI003D274726
MKKTKLLISTVLLGSIVAAGSVTSFAEEVINTENGTASIEFTENNEKPEIVDPLDPEKPLDPQVPVDEPDNEDTENLGPLSLDVYPARFDFGTHKVDMMGGEYDSTLTGIHYLQITDNRSDIHGWNVSVSRTEFEDTSAAAERKLAATLTLPIGTARNSMLGADATDTLTHSDTEFEIPVAAEDGSGAVSIFSAEENNGKATSTYVWDASQEKLTIGKGAAKTGNFTSTVNWTLSAMPEQ